MKAGVSCAYLAKSALYIHKEVAMYFSVNAAKPLFPTLFKILSLSLQVMPSPSPSLYKETTHLFADFSRLKPGDFRVDVSEASAHGVNCLKPEYIADYLMQVREAFQTNRHKPAASYYLRINKNFENLLCCDPEKCFHNC